MSYCFIESTIVIVEMMITTISMIMELTIAVVSALIIKAEGKDEINEIKNLNTKNNKTPNPHLKNTFLIISYLYSFNRLPVA